MGKDKDFWEEYSSIVPNDLLEILRVFLHPLLQVHNESTDVLETPHNIIPTVEGSGQLQLEMVRHDY